ncbi:MAG: hypothetical protein E6I27_16060 [Chloroflexi bacterium]|nr:MAG: hypothetical protein E6I27_16060 [Chloroflexota bacterium]
MPRFDVDRLNSALAARALDGEQLAQISGLHRSVVSRARLGRPIRLKTMVSITQALERTEVRKLADLLA